MVLAFGAAVLVPSASLAQSPQRIPRIGFLSALGAGAMATRTDAFRAGMRELGYVEGKNILIDFRYADGDAQRLTQMADEMVQQKMDVIVTSGPTTTPAARKATSSIPIVMGYDIDPVGAGHVASLARPGGNVTGLSGLSPELSGKQLQILKEIVPRLARVAVIGDSAAAGTAQSLSALEQAAAALKVHVQYVNVKNLDDIRVAFRDATKAQADAMVVFANGAATNNRVEVARLAQASRLPAIYYTGEFVEVGALITYGVSTVAMFKRAATYVDKILKGAKPGELPIEQPAVFDLVINMKTAKALGLKIPQSILLQATKVIQ